MTDTLETKKSPNKSPRTRAREFALQALYQHLVGKSDFSTLEKTTKSLLGFHKADALFFDTLLKACLAHHEALDETLRPYLDRPLNEVTPIEHVILWIGAHELRHCPETPWRVILDETIELAKRFGGPDGHKFVNAVLNQLANELRKVEISLSPANTIKQFDNP